MSAAYGSQPDSTSSSPGPKHQSLDKKGCDFGISGYAKTPNTYTPVSGALLLRHSIVRQCGHICKTPPSPPLAPPVTSPYGVCNARPHLGVFSDRLYVNSSNTHSGLQVLKYHTVWICHARSQQGRASTFFGSSLFPHTCPACSSRSFKLLFAAENKDKIFLPPLGSNKSSMPKAYPLKL